MIRCVDGRNAEALRAQSGCPSIPSASLFLRVSKSLPAEQLFTNTRITAVRLVPNQNRSEAVIGSTAPSALTMSEARASGSTHQVHKCGRGRNAETLSTQSPCPSIPSALSAPPRFKCSPAEQRCTNMQIPIGIRFTTKTKQKRGRDRKHGPRRHGKCARRKPVAGRCVAICDG